MTFLESIHTFVMRKAQRYIPGTPWNTICRLIDKQTNNILDVGCGDGIAIEMLCSKKGAQCKYMGVDIYQYSIDKAQEKAQSFSGDCEFILGDVRDIVLKEKSFDVVICLEVLEHLKKEDGISVLYKLEQIARRQIIMSFPVGKFNQKPIDDQDNPFMVHQSAWRPKELRNYGFQVRGYGIPIYGGSNSLMARLPKVLVFFRQAIWIAVTTFTYFIPELAGWMICVKSLDTKRS